jgi:hypothetical protein
MKWIALLAALLVLPVTGAAQAPEAIALEPGNAITLRVDTPGNVHASQRAPAEWTEYELAEARHLSGLRPPEKAVPTATEIPNEGMPAIPPIAPNMIRVKFFSIAGQHSLLVMANGYQQAVVYRARITRAGRSGPTDVCLVVPNHYGFEHWPEPIDRIEIYDVHLVAWQAGGPIPCA